MGEAGRRLNGIAEDHIDTFVNIADQFEIGDWDWWESRNIAERGPLSSTFVTECCRMVLFGECLDDGRSHLFAIENADLAAVLRHELRKRKISYRWFGPSQLKTGIASVVAMVLNAACLAKAACRRTYRLGRLRKQRRAHPAPLDGMRTCDVLVAAWTEPGDFPRQGPREVAHYMGLLPKYLRDDGFTVGFIALPLDWIFDPNAIVEDVVESTETMILADDAVTAGALWRAVFQSATIKARPKPDFQIKGQAMGEVAKMVLARERFDWRAVNARLMSRVGPFLAEYGCRPSALCHVYENQTWEKGLRAGFRRSLPETRIFGFHQSPFSTMYLNMLPSRKELSSDRWPDKVFTHGDYSRKLLTSTGASMDRVVNGGLFRQGSFILKRFFEPDAHRLLVVATGVDFQECCELVGKAAEAAATGEWTLIVNFHPATAATFRQRIRDFLAQSSTETGNIKMVDDPVSALLAEGADAILYADTNAAFEGISSGARAINIERDHALSFDKLPDGVSRRVYSVDEIRAALDLLDNDSAWPGQTEITAVLDACFKAADPKSVISEIRNPSGNNTTRRSETTEALER